MKDNTPHFLLLTATDSAAREGEGRWQFLLHRLDGSEVAMEASDIEPDICGQRLELLAVVRGLEALPQPSRVTLVTEDRYVVRGLRFGLQEWKANGWRWERFGRWVSVKHADLWQRLDRTLQYHFVRSRHDRFGVGAVRHAGGSFNRARRPLHGPRCSVPGTSLRPMVPTLVRRLQGHLDLAAPSAWGDSAAVMSQLG